MLMQATALLVSHFVDRAQNLFKDHVILLLAPLFN